MVGSRLGRCGGAGRVQQQLRLGQFLGADLGDRLDGVVDSVPGRLRLFRDQKNTKRKRAMSGLAQSDFHVSSFV